MKEGLKTAVVVLLFAIVLPMASASAQSFDPVFEAIEDYRAGRDIEVTIEMTDTDFAVYRSEVSDLSKPQYTSLLEQVSSPGLPQLKLLSDGSSESYAIDDHTTIEEVTHGNGLKSWRKITFSEVASFPVRDWPRFLEASVEHDLLEYRVIRIQKRLFIILVFRQIEPHSFRFGPRSLQFPVTACQFLKQSPTHAAWSGNGDGRFVVLVHEPHWSIVGQYQLIPGLKALTDANPGAQFRFLVEGSYERETKYVPTQPLLQAFGETEHRNRQTFGLVRSFMVDGPLAYRLIHDPALPAIAIDSPELIARTPREIQPESLIGIRKHLLSIYAKFENVRATKQKGEAAVKAFLDLFKYASANAQELTGQSLVDHWKTLARKHENLADRLADLPGVLFRSDSAFLRDQAKAYRSNAQRLVFALDRDRTMVRNIVAHFSSQYSQRIPVAFIGSFHTAGMTTLLRGNGIGYVVLEPRSVDMSSEQEHSAFNRALDPSSRSAYLAETAAAATTKLKSPVAPTPREISRYYAPYIQGQNIAVAQRRRRLASDLDAIDGHHIDPKLLDDVIDNNGSISQASISFGGGTPPPGASDAGFASFEPGDRNPRLFIHNAREIEWAGPGRYAFLKAAIYGTTSQTYDKGSEVTRFYRDPGTDQVYFSYYNSATNRFHLYECKSNMDAYPIFNAPAPSSEQEKMIIRLRLSELMMKLGRRVAHS